MAKRGFHVDMERETVENTNFRKVLFTGPHAQLVLMALKPGEDIGKEVHSNLDQFIRIDEGSGEAIIGKSRYSLKDGSAIIVPAGAVHNVVAGPEGLKLYAVYTTQNHPDGTVEKEKPMGEELKKGAAGERGVPDGSGPDGKGPTGRRRPPKRPRRDDFESDAEYREAMDRWNSGQKTNKSQDRRGMMALNKASISLVVVPGEFEKSHPAKLSTVNDKTKSKIPYTGHAERMKLAKMAADRMCPKPENAKKYQPETVDRKGREAGQKSPYSGYGTSVSGMGSDASDTYAKQTYVVKPSEIGSGTPEKATAHQPSTVRKPRG